MPAETTRLVVALRPDKSLDALVRQYKRRLLAAAGPQLYATDPPHATLYVADFTAGRMAAALRRAEHLAATIQMPNVALGGWHVFENDPLTGRNTLVCRLNNETCQRLRRVQLEVLAALAPLHDASTTLSAFSERLPLLSDEQRQRAILFGFPYVGDGWIPHLTIASVQPRQWPHVRQVFGLLDSSSRQIESLSCERGRFTALDIFELQGLEPHRLATFALATRHMGKAA
jgi:2'-5' RNA ligase